MTGAVEIDAEDKREALDFALNSRALHRAGQLKAILKYVVEADLAGRADELTEHNIGVDVLGRSPTYNAAEDSSVRTRAYELRHKLERLYLIEAPDAAVRIVLPKGSYAPHYIRRFDAPSPLPAIPPVAERAASAWRTPLLAGTIGLVVGLLAAWLYVLASLPGVDAIILEAWAPFASPTADVVLCVATPLHLTVGPATHTAAGTPTYPAPREAYDAFRRNRPLDPNASLGLLITNNVIGVGTMNAVVASVNTLRQLGSPWQVLPEHVAPLSSLRNRNAVLFGAPVDSAAVSTVLEATPLNVAYDGPRREFVIRDTRSSQAIVARKDADGEFVEVYGLITVLNNRESERGRLGMVVFSGITSTGTQGAAEFFSSARSLRDLKRRLGGKAFPTAYQVVVRCTFSDKLLLGYEYHSHRIFE